MFALFSNTETQDRYIPLIINAVDGSVIDPRKGY